MDNIQNILNKKIIRTSQSSRKININWEEAKQFGEYVGLGTIFVLKLFRVYGKGKVLGLQSWLKDCNHDPKRYAGLVVWKLKQK